MILTHEDLQIWRSRMTSQERRMYRDAARQEREWTTEHGARIGYANHADAEIRYNVNVLRGTAIRNPAIY